MLSIREEFNKLPGRNVAETAAELYMETVMPSSAHIKSFHQYMDIYDIKEELRPLALAFESPDDSTETEIKIKTETEFYSEF